MCLKQGAFKNCNTCYFVLYFHVCMLDLLPVSVSVRGCFIYRGPNECMRIRGKHVCVMHAIKIAQLHAYK